MTPEEQYTLLIQLQERMDSIEKKIDNIIFQAENGGWGRCRERGVWIKNLERKEEIGFDRAKWFNRLLVGSVAVLIIEKVIRLF